MKILDIAILTTGIVLVYSGLTGKDPRAVVKIVLTGHSPSEIKGSATAGISPSSNTIIQPPPGQVITG